MRHARIYPVAIGLIHTAVASVPAPAAITYGPQVAGIDLSRTWFDGSGAVLAADTASSGPLAFGPNTPGAVLTPTTEFSTNSLSAVGFPVWQVAGQARTTVDQSGNAQTMRAYSHAVSIAEILTPATGRGEVAITVAHGVDFQLSEPSAWQASLSTVLSSPIYPTLRIIRDPATTATTVVSESLDPTDFGMSSNYSGVLAAGSYRVLMSFPLSFDVPGGGSGFYGGVHSATAIFTVPAPGAAALLAGGGFALRRRRR